MDNDTRFDYCNRMIGEIATDLAQGYLQDGDFLSLYLVPCNIKKLEQGIAV